MKMSIFLKSYLRYIAAYNSSKIKLVSVLKELQSTTNWIHRVQHIP